MEYCPCGSEQPYESCCEPMISGRQAAGTAEALLRSRYSAFVKNRIQYIADTIHPDKRKALMSIPSKNGPEKRNGCVWKFWISRRAANRIRMEKWNSLPATSKTAGKPNTMSWRSSRKPTTAGIFSMDLRRQPPPLSDQLLKSGATIRARAEAGKNSKMLRSIETEWNPLQFRAGDRGRLHPREYE